MEKIIYEKATILESVLETWSFEKSIDLFISSLVELNDQTKRIIANNRNLWSRDLLETYNTRILNMDEVTHTLTLMKQNNAPKQQLVDSALKANELYRSARMEFELKKSIAGNSNLEALIDEIFVPYYLLLRFLEKNSLVKELVINKFATKHNIINVENLEILISPSNSFWRKGLMVYSSPTLREIVFKINRDSNTFMILFFPIVKGIIKFKADNQIICEANNGDSFDFMYNHNELIEITWIRASDNRIVKYHIA